MDHRFDKSYLFAASNTVDLQNYVAKIWEVLLNINYFVTDPRKKGLSAFIYMQSNNLDEGQGCH